MIFQALIRFPVIHDRLVAQPVLYYKKGTLASTPTDLTEATSSYPESGTEYTIYGLDALTDYAFFIKATSSSSITNDNGVDSDFSLPKTAKTNVAQPSNVANTIVTSGTNASIKITWDAVPSATSYKVYLLEVTDILGSNTIGSATLNKTVTTNEATITGFTSAKMYKFFVRASNSAGDGTAGDTSRLFWM